MKRNLCWLWRVTPGIVVLAAVAALALMAACTTNSSSSSDPTTRAISDPMHYEPQIDTDVSGGNFDNFDRNAFNKDLDHVLNP
jgi:hypothetical protein